MIVDMGADVVLLARDAVRLEATLKSLPPGRHAFHAIDLTHYDEIEPLISACVGENGKLDGFVHAAGIEMTKS